MTDPKPCPWCNIQPEVVRRSTHYGNIPVSIGLVFCPTCGVSKQQVLSHTPGSDERAAILAIVIWNTRRNQTPGPSEN